jgi:hypothetical protein
MYLKGSMGSEAVRGLGPADSPIVALPAAPVNP